MKLAYLISAYMEPEQLGNIIRALDTKEAGFFIHVDGKSDIQPFLNNCPQKENVVFVEERERVCWGGFTQVHAIMKMLKCALASPSAYERFISMTGTDYPIMSNEAIQNFFVGNRDKEMICTLKEVDHKRILRYELNDYANIREPLEKLSKKLIYSMGRALHIRKRHLPRITGKYVDVFSGSDYWAISRECAEYVYQVYKSDSKYNAWMKTTGIPSEKYVQTIMGNSEYASRCVSFEPGRPLAFMEYSPLHYVIYGDAIKILDIPDYYDIISSGKMLARKVYHEQSKGLMQLLDSYRENDTIADIQNGLVSIIVPVFNREKIVLNTIRSIKDQTYENIEYIIVDDGSTDRTYDVCVQAVAGDARGKVLHKCNGGVSSARNMGLENAHGRYIFFLDSDDTLVGNAIEHMMEILLEYKCVVAQGSYKAGHEKEQCRDMNYQEYYCSPLHEPVVWGKLYTRDIIGTTRFDESLPVREDVDFLYCIMKKAQRIAVSNFHLINMGDQPEHLNNSEESKNDLWDVIVNERAIERFTPERNRAFTKKLWGEYFGALVTRYVSCREDRKQIQKKFRKNVWKFWRNNITSFKSRILLMMGWLDMHIYIFVYQYRDADNKGRHNRL